MRVCELLYQHAQREQSTSFVQATDSFGNTAVHMAVKHRQLAALDWLVSVEEGRLCLDMANHEGLTPLTLAARYGLVEIYKHILYRHLSRVAWVFGQVGPARADARCAPPPPPPALPVEPGPRAADRDVLPPTPLGGLTGCGDGWEAGLLVRVC